MPLIVASVVTLGSVLNLVFRKQWEHQFEPLFPLFVSIARRRMTIYLSEHTGDATPNTLIHLEDPDRNRLPIASPRSS